VFDRAEYIWWWWGQLLVTAGANWSTCYLLGGEKAGECRARCGLSRCNKLHTKRFGWFLEGICTRRCVHNHSARVSTEKSVCIRESGQCKMILHKCGGGGAAWGGNSSAQNQVLTQFAHKSFIPLAVFIMHALNERASRCECDFPMQIFIVHPFGMRPIQLLSQTDARVHTFNNNTFLVYMHAYIYTSTCLSAALCMCALTYSLLLRFFLFALLLTACECVKFELVAARYFQGNAKCLIGLHTYTCLAG
jgi:hypothetical protein